MDESRKLSIKVEGNTLDSVSLIDPSTSKTSTILAYRPKYADYHSSNLAAIFVNIKKVFPCTEGISDYEPVCHAFTREEDGFRKGKAFIEAGDIGNNLKVFSTSVYALAIQDCPELIDDCLPKYLQTEVVCMLPRCSCP